MKITIGTFISGPPESVRGQGKYPVHEETLPVERHRGRTVEFQLEDNIDFSALDIVLLGGGSDREQMLVCDRLRSIQKDFKDYVEDNGVVIAVCGGYQLLGPLLRHG